MKTFFGVSAVLLAGFWSIVGAIWFGMSFFFRVSGWIERRREDAAQRASM